MSILAPCDPIALCLFFLCIYGAWKAKRKSLLDDLPGPPPESFLLGKLGTILGTSGNCYD